MKNPLLYLSIIPNMLGVEGELNFLREMNLTLSENKMKQNRGARSIFQEQVLANISACHSAVDSYGKKILERIKTSEMDLHDRMMQNERLAIIEKRNARRFRALVYVCIGSAVLNMIIGHFIR